MSDIGVLNLQIQSNAGSAASGLRNLADALTRVKTAVGKGLSLGIVGQQVTTLAKTINEAKGTSTTIKNLSELFNSIANFSKLGKVHIDVQPFKDIKEVLGNGLNLGQAGMQQVSEGFETVAGSIQECTAEAAKFQTAMNANNGMAKFDFSVFDPAKLPLGALGTKMDETAQGMQQYGQAVQETFEIIRDAGALDMVSGIQGVAEETNALILYNENLENSWERISERIRETGSAMSENNDGMRVFSSIEEMARELGMTVDEVRQKLSETYNTIYNGGNNVTVFSSIEEAARAMGMSIEQATEQARRNVESLYGIMNESPRIGAAQALAKVTADAQEASPAMASFQSSMDETKGGSERLTGSLKNLDRELKEKKTDTDAVSHSFGSLKQTLKDMFPYLDRIRQQFGRILMRRAITAVIRSITKAFSEGVENVYRYSQAIGSGFAPALDSAKSMMTQFKNSIGAAVAPLIQALIPVFNQIVSAAINVINVLNQLFSLLSGRSTWTRALPQATQAFESTEKAAKGAGGAVKDMLAAWDELNVLDQNGGGGGGGGAAAAAVDYANMFEEVLDFESGIKDFVGWLEDHMELLHGLALGIVAALAGLPASISIGIGLLAAGIETSFNAGYDIGMNGLNEDNFLKACVGVLESTLGGGLIGWKIGGTGGALIGATIGFSIALVSLGVGMAFAERVKLYGQIHWEAEMIKQQINNLFKYDDIKVQIEKMELDHLKLQDAKRNLGTAIEALQQDFNWDIIRLGVNNKDTLQKMIEDVNNLVNATNFLITLRNQSIKVGLEITTQFDNPEEVIKFSEEKFSGIQEYVTELGATINKILEDGISIDEAKTIEKLKGQISRITSAIEGGRLAGEFISNIQRGYSGTTWQNLDQETLTEYMKQYEDAVSGYKNALYDQAFDTKESLGALYYGMVEQNAQKPGSYTDAEIEQARRNYMNFDIDKDVEDKWQYYGEEGRQIFTRNVNEAISAVVGRKKNWDSTLANKTVLKGKLENLKNWIVTNIADNIGFDEKILIDAFSLMEITGWEVLGEDARKNMIYTLQKQFGIGSELYTMLKSQLNVPIDDILATNQTAWDKWGIKEKLKFATALVQAYGSSEAMEAAKKIGIDIQAAIDEGLGSDNGKTRKAAQKLSNMIQSELDKKEIIIRAVADIKATLETEVNVSTNFFDKVKNATIGKTSTVLNNVGTILANIQKNADGAYGIPNGDLFIANDAGPEFIGRIGAKNTVANQGQIVEGISAGVEAANEEQNALLREQNNLLRRILAKDSSVRLDASASLGRVTQRSLEMYGSMVGG